LRQGGLDDAEILFEFGDAHLPLRELAENEQAIGIGENFHQVAGAPGRCLHFVDVERGFRHGDVRSFSILNYIILSYIMMQCLFT
jgi:hypothetical protein